MILKIKKTEVNDKGSQLGVVKVYLFGWLIIDYAYDRKGNNI